MPRDKHIVWNDFAGGTVIREPLGQSKGYWVGAPGAFYDQQDQLFYLTYRIRRPRGVAPDRGGESRIARSQDGITFEDIWTVNKEVFSTASMERSALRKGGDGRWHYFTSFVDPRDGRWCVAALHADRIENLEPQTARPLFSAADQHLEGVKDPWILERAGLYYMFVSVALPTARTTASSHATLDIYNTGECLSATALAVSPNLDDWEWQGVILRPAESGWDQYCRRLNSVIPVADGYLGFYDGNASHHENYEEKTGLVESPDLRSWYVLTRADPFLTSPYSSGSLRYLDALIVQDKLYTYFEFARSDGAHDLRVLRHSFNRG